LFWISNKIDMNYIRDKFSLSEHLFSLSVVLSIMIPIWYNISFISNLIDDKLKQYVIFFFNKMEMFDVLTGFWRNNKKNNCRYLI
jgi:hypothetical protein